MNKIMLKDFKLPKKFSYPKKPITLEADVKIKGERLTGKIKKTIIHRTTELAGIVPFDWFLCDDCKQHFVMMFGFDTMESALAAQTRLKDSNFIVFVKEAYEAAYDEAYDEVYKEAYDEGRTS